MSTPSELVDKLPTALEAVYQTPSANSDVPLYEGRLRLFRTNRTLEGAGTVKLAWFPSPSIRFEIEGVQGMVVDLLGEAKLELVERWQTEMIEVRVTSARLSSGSSTRASGVLQKWRRHPDAKVSRILFHIPNFRYFRGDSIRSGGSMWAGRASLKFGDWAIDIDEIGAKDLSPDLKATGGYGITHVGCIARSDGGKFVVNDAAQCIDGLFWFLSFCNGRWTGPALQIGYDENSEAVSHEWAVSRVAPWRPVQSWFSDLHLDVAGRVYPGFAEKWSSDVWQDAIRGAMYWYVTGNAPGVAIENGVILAHVGFETLGWALLVDDAKAISNDGYQRLEAADKLRLLLHHCRIPHDVPSHLPALQAAAKAENWSDGPSSLAAVRNAHVHTSPKNRERLARAGDQAEFDAWHLGMYYFELILLNLFDYRGEFSNRLIGDVFTGQEVSRVPWVS